MPEANQIVVMDKGLIVEVGNHEMLMKNKESIINWLRAKIIIFRTDL